MREQNNGSWKEMQQRTALMAQTASAGLRIVKMGIPCVKCHETFTMVWEETTGRALVVAGGVKQSTKRLYWFCFKCVWGGTPEDAQQWLDEHRTEVADGETPESI